MKIKRGIAGWYCAEVSIPVFYDQSQRWFSSLVQMSIGTVGNTWSAYALIA
jgi:hypothetical protein